MSGESDQVNVIYINGDCRNHCFQTSGISFREFASNIPSPLHYALLLKHKFSWADSNDHTLLEYVEEENMQRLIATDVKEFGEFCWVDFDDVHNLDALEQLEIAELLYLAHKKEPLGKPFFPLLKNKYVYLSHDDGWLNKVYYKRIQDFTALLGKVIPYKLSSFSKRKFSLFQKAKVYPAIPQEIINQLLPLTEDGLLIDVSYKMETKRGLEIPVYVVGSFENMGEVFEYLQPLKEEATARYLLLFDRKTQEWKWEE